MVVDTDDERVGVERPTHLKPSIIMTYIFFFYKTGVNTFFCYKTGVNFPTFFFFFPYKTSFFFFFSFYKALVCDKMLISMPLLCLECIKIGY